MRLLFTALGALCVVDHAVVAQTSDTRLELCLAENDATAMSTCSEFLSALRSAFDQGPVRGFRACIPASVGFDQLRRAVVEHMRNYPDYRTATRIYFVATALSREYPCR